METLYQRGPDGNCVPGDAITHAAYGLIPVPFNGEFQTETGRYAVPVTVHGWVYSVTFGRWSALVTFENGWKGYTWPRVRYA